jgi:glycosyltransferase involved in cell wall biosynthesis
MQEIKKRRIVLASVLKPVNDPRMVEKIGQSLSRHYEVHIIGTKGDTLSNDKTIFFHPLSGYARFSINRIVAPLRILGKILRIKPAIFIICTHELLWVALIAKTVLHCKVIYDIQENYFRNILYTNAFPQILRVFIALYVRTKEWITAPFVNTFFLAEAGYTHELKFTGTKKVILENKVKKISIPVQEKWSEEDHNTHLLFSGTLADTTGVFMAIDLATRLHSLDHTIRLHIIGFSPMPGVRREIKNLMRDKSFIFFEESLEPIPHTMIIQAIQMADVGIIAYPHNLSTENRIPTKLFEYLCYTLPILLINHSPWIEICRKYAAAIPFEPNNFNERQILDAIKQNNFYKNEPIDIFWETEEKKLFETIASLLNNSSK